MSFVHLHVHSEYSLLDGLSRIPELVQRARELEMPALALTDHGAMFGAVRFYREAMQAGVKPIIGMEAYLAPRGMEDRDPQRDSRAAHLLLLAENDTGYRNLLKIATAAQLEGFYYRPRIDHEYLAQHSEGLICTTGCMSGEVPRALAQGREAFAKQRLDWYFELFGRDRFFLELQHHDIPELEQVNRSLIDLAPKYDARFVATNDVHYVRPEDADLQDVLLCIQTGSVRNDPDRMRMTDESYYLRSAQEMQQLLGEVEGAIDNTLWIAERALDFEGYRLPPFEVPEGETKQSYLRSLCEQGLQRRYGPRAEEPQFTERLDYELGVIHEMGFDAYFLIVWDLCRYAREEGIWYNARGSAAGSIVAYCLGITLVDPLEHGLIFERFLNPGRVSMPDIDLDFQDDRRHLLLEYTARKYGTDKVAQIITFGTLGARAAIRDVGRVLDIPLPEVDRVAKAIPNIPGKPVTIPEALKSAPALREAYDRSDYMRELIETAAKLEGVSRNAGTHAAGVIITDKPITEYIPLHRPTKGDQHAQGRNPIRAVTQFEMGVLESLGLLKIDYLGLSTLTVMARACELIQRRHGITLDIDSIPLDDPKTYELLGSGDVLGVFQVEGAGMRRYLMEMKPKELAHVTAMVALYRPGPMEFIPAYIRRMHGEEEVSYRHAALEPILEETFGITVYQEQIMYTAMNVAGYSASEADNLRKAVAKKKAKALKRQRAKFVEGAMENGIPDRTANAIFDDWEAFARYGFPKGHAADYAVICVQTAYLKAHYPIEFMAALLSVYKGVTDRVALYSAESRRMGLEVLPPDVCCSALDFEIEDREVDEPGKPKKQQPTETQEHPLPEEAAERAVLRAPAEPLVPSERSAPMSPSVGPGPKSPAGSRAPSAIRYGLGAVKNVGQGAVETIIEARGDGPFVDLEDFSRRVDLRQVGKRALESLIRVGALDSLGERLDLLDSLDRIVSYSASHFRAAEVGQLSIFGDATGVAERLELQPARREVPWRRQLGWEKELLGSYVSDHPLAAHMDQLTQVVSHYSGEINESNDGQVVSVAGEVCAIRPYLTRKGNEMGFITLEDLQGTLELVVFHKLWKSVAEAVSMNQIVLVKGRVDAGRGEPKLLVDEITSDLKATGDLRESGQRSPRMAIAEPAATDIVMPESAQMTPTERPTEAGTGLPDPEAAEDKSEGGSGSASSDPVESQSEATTGQSDSEPQSLTSVIGLDSAVEDAQETLLTFWTGPEPCIITILLRSSGERQRDARTMRQVHGLLSSNPGADQFIFQIHEADRRYHLQFPNSTTRYSRELHAKLVRLVGDECVNIGPLRLH
jgi:DNA polymerase-3 subunit alpha